ncbi:pyridoxamine 5'-phosphate oxidase family protein [Slackia isoflavoniconvertens]|uniref:pyridoxamine 5'-phosphate oxidase family protein n=1 Tax=Slackia isoflavoniconvertens TaxID=572010 RepID=UPI003A984657
MSENEMPADGLEKVLQYMTSVPAWYLATSVGGQPHVRPFSFAQIQDGKLWFVTATTKDVWQELLQNQLFEATSWWPGHGWLILRGKAGLIDEASPEMREAGWQHLEGLGEHYDGPNDETLVFFSADEPQAWICDHEEWVPVEL